MFKYDPAVSAGHLIIGGSFLVPLVSGLIWGVATWKDVQNAVSNNTERIVAQRAVDAAQDHRASTFREDVLKELRLLNDKSEQTNRELSGVRVELAHMRGALEAADGNKKKALR